MPNPPPERGAELLEPDADRLAQDAAWVLVHDYGECATHEERVEWEYRRSRLCVYAEIAVAVCREQRAALAAKDALLRELEWLPLGLGGEVLCPVCFNDMQEGHEAGCRLRAALPAEEADDAER